MKVNAVVVTYNRKELLQLCVDHLLEQTHKLNKIVIVDNASSDGTAEFLQSLNDDIFDIVYLDKNLGGAGGFYHGIKRAYELKCDYLWIMDDDTISTPSAVEGLLNGMEILNEKKVGFLTSNVLFRDESPCMMNIPDTVHRWNEFIAKGIVEISHTSFVAMFIPSFVVKEVGLPIKEYFIWGDDGEYSTRILRAGYSGYLVADSTVYHYMKDNVGVDIFNTPKERIDRFYFFYRNTTITFRIRGIKSFCKILLYHDLIIAKLLFSKTDHKFKKMFTVLRGTIAGMFKRVKIDAVN